MKSIVLFLFMIGVIMIVVGYTKEMSKNENVKIEYRYIPRNQYEDQMEPDKVSSIFSSMFNNKSVWSTYPFNSNNDPDNKPGKNCVQELDTLENTQAQT